MPSPDAVLEALSELKTTMAAIEARLAALESGEASAVGLTRRLGLDVVEMGDALSRRLRALEQQPPPAVAHAPPAEVAPPIEATAPAEVAPPIEATAPAEVAPPAAEAAPETALFIARSPPVRRNNRLIAVSVGMLLALILVLAGAWALQFYNVRSPGSPAATRSAAGPTDAGAVTIAPPTPSNTAAISVSPLPAARRAPHRQAPITDLDASGEPIGHVLYNAATPPPPKP